MNKGLLGVLVTAVALALPLTDRSALAQDPAAEAEQAFEAAYAAFAEAYRQGDPAAVTALYTEDAFYLSPGSEITQGQVASHFDWLSSFDPGTGPVLEFEIVDREVSGRLAYDIGYYKIRRPDAATGSGSRGKFIVIWKQADDGAWRIHADGFSEVRESAAPAGEGR